MIVDMVNIGHFPWWGVLLVCVVPLVLGYLIRKSQETHEYFAAKDEKVDHLKSTLKEKEDNISHLKRFNTQLKNEIEYLKTIKQLEIKNKAAEIQQSVNRLVDSSKTTSVSKPLMVKRTASPSNLYPHLQDNLLIIEGMTPLIEAHLKSNGITSWNRLSAQTNGELRKLMMTKEGNTPVDYSSWQEQARLADLNEWDRLIRLQKSINGNKNSRVEKLIEV